MAGSSAAAPVVIVGGGQGGVEAAASLRSRGFDGPITVVTAERQLPYQRPPLSKGYLAGTVSAEELQLRPAEFYADQNIALLTGERVAGIDTFTQRVALASGSQLPYGHLVLATGARPRTLPVPGTHLAGVHTLRGLGDAEVLRDRLRPDSRLLVIGAGFVGLELAATARKAGVRVTVVEAGSRVMARAVSPILSAHLAATHRRQGVRLLLRREVTALRGDGIGRVRLAELNGRERVEADLVVIGAGVLPRTELATSAGLPAGDGVLVNRMLRTSAPGVYAIGDCARFPSPHAGRPVRLESVQNAADQGRCVASGICGEPAPYTAVPWFWTEQYDLRVQLAGITSGADHTVTSGDVRGGRFSVFCFRDGRLIGTESVNRAADHMITRRLLAAGSDAAAGLTAEDVAAPGFDLKEFQRARQPQ